MTAPLLPLDERLALALVEDCGTELDEADIAYVVEAVLPVARRYGAFNLPRSNTGTTVYVSSEDARAVVNLMERLIQIAKHGLNEQPENEREAFVRFRAIVDGTAQPASNSGGTDE